MKQVLFSHVTGNSNSKQAAVALAEVGSLLQFHTTMVWSDQGLLAKVLPCAWSAMLRRRAFPDAVQPFLKSHPWREVMRQVRRRLGVNRWAWMGDIGSVTSNFDMAVAQSVPEVPNLNVVYAYMDAAEQTFEAARRRGIQTIYELPTPYWRFTRDVVLQEASLKPEWAGTLPVLEEGSVAMRRRDRELHLADLILVPSALVRDSLKLAPPFQAKVHVIPYGCPEPLTGSVVDDPRDSKLRVLYVGSLNQGKGLAYLAEAMTGLEEVATLTVIGSRTADVPCAALDRFLAAHRHLAHLPHAAVLAEMQKHDVLVLPTLYEGLALVLLEAMACGLTVITTSHSGLAGLIKDGQEGFLVPIRSATAIHARLRQLAGDRSLLLSMRNAALAWSQDHSWRHFREQLREIIHR